MATRPCTAATCSGVLPYLSMASLTAPAATSASTTASECIFVWLPPLRTPAFRCLSPRTKGIDRHPAVVAFLVAPTTFAPPTSRAGAPWMVLAPTKRSDAVKLVQRRKRSKPRAGLNIALAMSPRSIILIWSRREAAGVDWCRRRLLVQEPCLASSGRSGLEIVWDVQDGTVKPDLTIKVSHDRSKSKRFNFDLATRRSQP
mmetsp:Transcript_20270/g.47054  ORF Transcript_20270/g.47054 Transcript_20270/m.47054 type:complete len:201 (-) Transcript_20270:134-736(-)